MEVLRKVYAGRLSIRVVVFRKVSAGKVSVAVVVFSKVFELAASQP